MDLSIVIAMYNVKEYLSNCLESLLNQDLNVDEYEVLIINDGSTDGSDEIAKKYAQKYSQIKVFDQQNQGQAAARNRGIEFARGRYIHFLDSDDYLAYQTLPYCIKMMHEHRLDMLGLSQRLTSKLDMIQSENYDVILSEKLTVTDGITYIANNQYGNESTWYLIRREYLLKTGIRYPIGRFVEDAIFTAQLLAGCSRIAISSLDFYRYVIRPSSTMNKRDQEHALKMIHDYEQNVYDFELFIERLKELSHPELDACLERIEARQQSFVFFLLVKCVKFKLSKNQLAPILTRLNAMGAYPMNKFISKDYNGFTYRSLTGIMNNRNLMFAIARVLSFSNYFMVKTVL